MKKYVPENSSNETTQGDTQPRTRPSKGSEERIWRPRARSCSARWTAAP